MKHKRLWWSGIILALCIAGANGMASAHSLESDNGVHGVLHIAPDDAPVSGRATRLVFYLGSERTGFSVQDCGCSLTVSLRGQIIARPQLGLDGSTLVATTTFPQAGSYDVILGGRGFRLPFDADVAGGATPPNVRVRGFEVLGLSAASLGALISIAVQRIVQGGRYRQKP